MSDKERDVAFLDLFNPLQPRSEKSLADQRMDICKQCPFFSKKQTCKKCGCIMRLKTTLKNAKCPVGQW